MQNIENGRDLSSLRQAIKTYEDKSTELKQKIKTLSDNWATQDAIQFNPRTYEQAAENASRLKANISKEKGVLSHELREVERELRDLEWAERDEIKRQSINDWAQKSLETLEVEKTDAIKRVKKAKDSKHRLEFRFASESEKIDQEIEAINQSLESLQKLQAKEHLMKQEQADKTALAIADGKVSSGPGKMELIKLSYKVREQEQRLSDSEAVLNALHSLRAQLESEIEAANQELREERRSYYLASQRVALKKYEKLAASHTDELAELIALDIKLGTDLGQRLLKASIGEGLRVFEKPDGSLITAISEERVKTLARERASQL